jgi:2-polyprenyl-3-methyl-5-hydroxy-6-metoxy-1,4-benzoquinol methylase
MSDRGWNHNIQYYALVLKAIPSPCESALDVGCGQGALARLLADRCERVIAIDMDAASLASAMSGMRAAHLTFRCADVMVDDFEGEGFDFITIVAALHHLPLRPALTRLRGLLKPGGVLAVVGLYRVSSISDFALLPISFVATWLTRRFRRFTEVDAPKQDPVATLDEIREAAKDILPGVAVRRRLFFRYSLVWQKPVM